MALDLGQKRIGVALSDPSRTLASSHGYVKRSSREADFRAFRLLVEEHEVAELVIGLPARADGSEGPIALWARDYAADLASKVNLPFTMWDESFTSKDAEISLRERGIRGRELRQRLDAAAAAFLLQSFLDYDRESDGPEGFRTPEEEE